MGNNQMVVDQRVFKIAEEMWPACVDYMHDEHFEQVLAQCGLYDRYQKGDLMSFELFLDFCHAFFQSSKEHHPAWGYDGDIVSKIQAQFAEFANDRDQIECSQIFDILEKIGQSLGPQEQKQMLNEIKTADEGAGMLSSLKFLELLRRMDDTWEYQERKVEIAIIDETKYSGNDLGNLRQLH